MSDDTMKLFGDKKIPSKEMFKRLSHYILPEWKAFALAFFLIIINVAADVVLPLFLKVFTDKVSESSTTLAFIISLSIGSFLLSVTSQLLIYFESMILQKTGQRIVYKLRMEVFEHIENMSQNQFNIMPVGSLVTRVANYTTALSDLFTNVIVALIRNILTILGVYCIMFYLSWKLSLVLTGFVVVVFIASLVFRTVVTKVFRQERQYTSDLNTFVNENISGMKIIQAFNQEKRKEEEFNVKNNQLRKTKFKAVMAFAIYRPFVNFLYYSALAVTFIVGVSFDLGPGEIVA
ncbi:MAG: ABC transporter ATP-binding protein, partial [Bacilli bacterium]|nr:ABC transporter ATP-binding protein [Bacilli bacterium]